jgi:REP element-mobilizing transposase RayT
MGDSCNAGSVARVPRIARSQLGDGFFHATARAIRGAILFETDLDRLDFLKLLRFTTVAFDWHCRAYCLMGTHYHLVLETTREQLSNGMRKLNGDYARRFNKRHGWRGHLFAERFASFALDDEQHLHAAVEYVHQNPVRARLCDRAADWPWSG